jgi:hypothetical protein
MHCHRPIIEENKNDKVLIKWHRVMYETESNNGAASFHHSESCVINISKDNCSLNEPVLFIKTVSSCICCVATKLREWHMGKFLILRADVTSDIPLSNFQTADLWGGKETSSGAHSGALPSFVFCIFGGGQWINV